MRSLWFSFASQLCEYTEPRSWVRGVLHLCINACLSQTHSPFSLSHLIWRPVLGMKCDHAPLPNYLLVLVRSSMCNQRLQQASALQRGCLQEMNYFFCTSQTMIKCKMILQKQQRRCRSISVQQNYAMRPFTNQNTRLIKSYCWRYCKKKLRQRGSPKKTKFQS